MSARRPTAAERTISLFTGKTDLEEPLRGRDGTLPAELDRPSRRGKRFVWHLAGGHYSWAYGIKGPNETYDDRGRIRAERGEYHAWAVSLASKPRVFTSLIKAAEYVEDAVAGLYR